VGRQTGYQGASCISLEGTDRKARGRLDAAPTKPGERDGMARSPDGLEDLGKQPGSIRNQRPHQPLVGGGITIESPASFFQRSPEHHGTPAVEWMSHRHRRLDELEAVFGERATLKEGRGHGQWMSRRTYIVDEARERQLRRPGPATEPMIGLEHIHRAPGAGQDDRRGQAVGS
jgi:hypothetical protein